MNCQTCFIFIFLQVFAVLSASENARQVHGGVELLRTGPYAFELPHKLQFGVFTESCSESIELCYPAKAVIDEKGNFYVNSNYANRCGSKECAITIEKNSTAIGGYVDKQEENKLIFSFDDTSEEFCPRKINGTLQNFVLTRLPSGCKIVVIGASLPSNSDEKENNGSPWIGILSGVAVVTLFGIFVAGAMYLIYRYTIKQSIKIVSNQQHTPSTATPSPLKNVSVSNGPNSVVLPTAQQ